MEIKVKLKKTHEKQREFINSEAKRKVIKAGRRSGKTTGLAIIAVQNFLNGRRVLYASPTQDQVEKFWNDVCVALQDGIDKNIFYKNETRHLISYANDKIAIEGGDTKSARIRAKTAWNADTLRGDYADLLILDEYQLMNEDTWGLVGAPMLLDNNGDAVFCFTPPSLRTRSVSKADNPRHAIEFFNKAKEDKTGRWKTFHFTSYDNPYLSKEALDNITGDMSAVAIRQEILAEDVDTAPGALWKRENIEANRRTIDVSELENIIVAIDPSTTSEGDEAGIVVCGKVGEEYYVLDDCSIRGSPQVWAERAISAYYAFGADKIVYEANQGGEMVEIVLRQVDTNVKIDKVFATRGKRTRAEPIAVLYEKNLVHHTKSFPALEDEMCLWMPGDKSPNRMDALVWALTALMNYVKPAIIDFDEYENEIILDRHKYVLKQLRRNRNGDIPTN